MMSIRALAQLMLKLIVYFASGDLDAVKMCEADMRSDFKLAPVELHVCFEKL